VLGFRDMTIELTTDDERWTTDRWRQYKWNRRISGPCPSTV